MSFPVKLLLIALALTPAASLAAVPPTGAISRETYDMQTAADEAYQDDDFATAMSLYRDELAPKGDKYAQYMVGLMLQNGQGVARDPVTGAAWLSIAADRGDERLSAARDEAIAALDADQKKALSAKVASLAGTLGDCAVVTHRLALTREQRAAMIAGNDHGEVVIIDDKAYLIDMRTLRRDIYEFERYLKRHCAN